MVFQSTGQGVATRMTLSETCAAGRIEDSPVTIEIQVTGDWTWACRNSSRWALSHRGSGFLLFFQLILSTFKARPDGFHRLFVGVQLHRALALVERRLPVLLRGEHVHAKHELVELRAVESPLVALAW